MELDERRRESVAVSSWAVRNEAAAAVDAGLKAAAGTATSALLLPLVVAGSALLYALKGGMPRISGRVGGSEKAAMRRALRSRLAALVSAGTAFRLSSVLSFAWQRVHVVGAMEDARRAFPHLDAATARRLGSERSDVLVIVRAPDDLVRIDLGPDYSLVSADPAGLAGPDILVSTIRIAGVRHLRLASTTEPPAT